MKRLAFKDGWIFARIAEADRFSRAAPRLGLPKSIVSRRMTRFEARLGEHLMRRTTRRLRLTEFGAPWLEHAHLGATDVEAVKARAEHR